MNETTPRGLGRYNYNISPLSLVAICCILRELRNSRDLLPHPWCFPATAPPPPPSSLPAQPTYYLYIRPVYGLHSTYIPEVHDTTARVERYKVTPPMTLPTYLYPQPRLLLPTPNLPKLLPCRSQQPRKMNDGTGFLIERHNLLASKFGLVPGKPKHSGHPIVTVRGHRVLGSGWSFPSAHTAYCRFCLLEHVVRTHSPSDRIWSLSAEMLVFHNTSCVTLLYVAHKSAPNMRV
jgi:hypothetical protein